MKIINSNVRIELSNEEIKNIGTSCTTLVEIADKLKSANLQWISVDDDITYAEFNISDLYDIAEKLEMLSNNVSIEAW